MRKKTRIGRAIADAGCLLILAALSTAADRSTSLAQTSQPAGSPAQNASDLSVRPPLSLEDRADIFMARKQYAEAADYYMRALKQPAVPAESAATLWNKMGIAYQQTQKLDDARKAYKQALRKKKQFPEAWNNLGTTYFIQKKFGSSIKYYRQAIALEPGSASFHSNLANSYCSMKKYKEAMDEYRTALTLDPNLLREHSATGTVLDAHDVGPDYFFYLGKTFASMGRTEEAVRYLRRAFEDGFKDYKLLDSDPDFLKISKDPLYVELRSHPPVAIKD